MFIGHYGAGFAAKSAAPRASLGTMFLAAQFIDLLWPTFLLLGVETVRIVPGATIVTPLEFTHYPVSHSLLLVAIWSVLIGGGYYLLRHRRKEAVVVGLAVLSHWFLDLIVHRPDLPLYPGGIFLGLGLWSSFIWTIAIELVIFALGVWLYLRGTQRKKKGGTLVLCCLVGLLLLIYTGNLLGPPPPNETSIAWVGQSQWLIVALGYWADSLRQTRVIA